MKQKQVFLAVDAANLFRSACQNGSRLNYRALLDLAGSLGKVVRAALYVPRHADDKQKGFLVATKLMGFDRVVARHPHQRPDGSEKSDIDTQVIMEVWEAAVKGEIDAVVLASGDSDFCPLVDGLVGRGIEVWVVGPDGSTAWEMIVGATHFRSVKQVTGLLEVAPAAEAPLYEEKAA